MGLTILVVARESELLHRIRRFLEAARAKVLAASSLETAVRNAELRRPHASVWEHERDHQLLASTFERRLGAQIPSVVVEKPLRALRLLRAINVAIGRAVI